MAAVSFFQVRRVVASRRSRKDGFEDIHLLPPDCIHDPSPFSPPALSHGVLLFFCQHISRLGLPFLPFLFHLFLTLLNCAQPRRRLHFRSYCNPTNYRHYPYSFHCQFNIKLITIFFNTYHLTLFLHCHSSLHFFISNFLRILFDHSHVAAIILQIEIPLI